MEFSWVWPAIIISGAAAGVLSVAMFIVALQTATDERASAKAIVDEMDEIFAEKESRKLSSPSWAVRIGERS